MALPVMGRVILLLHQQPFEHGNLYAATVQDKQTFSLHLVELPRNFLAGAAHLLSQARHQNVKCLRPCRTEGVLNEKADERSSQCLCGALPRVVAESLDLSGQQVEHVDAENQLGVQSQQHFLLVDGNEVAGCFGAER